jgi:hypothetical protein
MSVIESTDYDFRERVLYTTEKIRKINKIEDGRRNIKRRKVSIYV